MVKTKIQQAPRDQGESDILTISFALPKDSYVRLEIFDASGKSVALLVNREVKAGYKTIRWDASSIGNGIYFYRLQAGDFVVARKIILLK